MRLDFCTGQIYDFPLASPFFQSLDPALLASCWSEKNQIQVIFKMFVGWSNVQRIWYEFESKLLWLDTLFFLDRWQQNSSSQSWKWNLKRSMLFWIKQLIWHYYHLDESSSCLRCITLLFRIISAITSGKKRRLHFQTAVENMCSSAAQAEKLVFKRLISQTGFPRL